MKDADKKKGNVHNNLNKDNCSIFKERSDRIKLGIVGIVPTEKSPPAKRKSLRVETLAPPLVTSRVPLLWSGITHIRN